MCPDKQILSSFVDGELAGRWETVIEKHVFNCSRCREIVDRYHAIDKQLASLTTPNLSQSKSRVWQLLVAAREELILSTPPFWRRRISVPVPALAAAFTLVLVLGFALFFNLYRNGLSTMKITTEPSGLTEVQVAAPIQDMERLLAALESQTGNTEVLIQLPEDSEFLVFSEPVLLKAADYRRGLNP